MLYIFDLSIVFILSNNPEHRVIKIIKKAIENEAMSRSKLLE